jgi:phosphotransferase system enzyme I (PtsI)
MRGIPVSAGVAMGKAVVSVLNDLQISPMNISNVEFEIQRFAKGVEQAKGQIKKIQEAAAIEFGRDKEQIFTAHLLMLEDPELLNTVESRIRNEKVNAEYAVQKAMDFYTSALRELDDPYLRERAADIQDVGSRVIRILMGKDTLSVLDIHEKCIIVAHDLTPSETAQIDREQIMGFATDIGGTTSHTAIMARSLGIPAIVGLQEATSRIRTGDQIIIDGETGEVFINPDQHLIGIYHCKQAALEKSRRDLLRLKEAVSVTRDGRRIEVAANIGHSGDVGLLLENGADGVGLFRTEFLFMDRDNLPTEEDQFLAYKQILAAVGGKPVVIRTLDIGGDKKLDYLPIAHELNPFLGYRALRLCLDRQDIFKTQLRAILRASPYGNLKVMFPMVSSLEELRQARQIAGEVQQELERQGIYPNKNIEWGIMIEIPSAALISDILASEADFFSLGTNDLIQYTLAVDRTNEKVSGLYEPYHPAVLRLIKIVIANAHQAGKRVGMCGEMAADTRLIPLLIGLGLDELSVSPSLVLQTKKIIRSLEIKKAETIANEALKFNTAAELKIYLENTLQNIIEEEGNP